MCSVMKGDHKWQPYLFLTTVGFFCTGQAVVRTSLHLRVPDCSQQQRKLQGTAGWGRKQCCAVTFCQPLQAIRGCSWDIGHVWSLDPWRWLGDSQCRQGWAAPPVQYTRLYTRIRPLHHRETGNGTAGSTAIHSWCSGILESRFSMQSEMGAQQHMQNHCTFWKLLPFSAPNKSQCALFVFINKKAEATSL